MHVHQIISIQYSGFIHIVARVKILNLLNSFNKMKNIQQNIIHAN